MGDCVLEGSGSYDTFSRARDPCGFATAPLYRDPFVLSPIPVAAALQVSVKKHAFGEEETWEY